MSLRIVMSNFSLSEFIPMHYSPNFSSSKKRLMTSSNTPDSQNQQPQEQGVSTFLIVVVLVITVVPAFILFVSGLMRML